MWTDDFQEQIWNDKYRYKDESFDGFCDRISSNIFKEDLEKKELLKKKLEDFKILFGGRINANIGVNEKGLTLFNCYICPTSKDNMDSLGGILDLLKDYAMTLKSEGGIGFCANFLRPENTIITGVGVTTPGVCKFLEMFDKTSEVITSGSVSKETAKQGVPTKNSIRKGATMVTLDIRHPDIESFITAKASPNRLNKMNMSVLVTDEFIKAMENNLDWDLIFPDINHEKYDEIWDGNFNKWLSNGYPTVVYKTIKAESLWNLLLENSYKRNEPGILFIDNANKMDNVSYLEGCSVQATNPCVVGDTLVKTTKGDLHIKDLKLEDDLKILTYNTITNKIEEEKLRFVGKTNDLSGLNPIVIKIIFDNNDWIKLTPEHRVYTKNRGYIESIDLNQDDIVCNYTRPCTETHFKELSFCESEDVYDLTTEKNHNFFANNILIHNCGEVPGSTGTVVYNDETILIGDVCDLGSLNLVKFYKSFFDFDEFLDCIELLVRSLDNIIDISEYPLKIYEDGAKLKRKIGLGITGVGSLAMIMNQEYGSEDHLKFLNILLSKTINRAYQTSALLAEEKGTFPLYDRKLLDCGFVHNSDVLTEETKYLIQKHGLRNSALMAIAPNGTLSILAGNVSSGVEPVFSKEFYRWNRMEDKKVDFNYPNIHKGEWFETDYLKENIVNNEKILESSDGNYRIDKNSGLCRKIKIEDYGYKIAKELKYKNTKGAMELSIDNHLKVLSVFCKYIDQAVSKTISIPSDTSYEDFKKLYSNIYSYGIKGCTTYREGSMPAVLESIKKSNEKTILEQQEDFLDAFKNQNGDIIAQDVRLPEEFPSKGYILKSEGKKWYVHVAFKDRKKTRPFALFVTTNNREDNTSTFNALEKLEALALYKGLRSELVEQIKQKYSYQKNPVKICRMLGLLLRHNIAVYDIVLVMNEVEADVGSFIFRIKKFLTQFIVEVKDPIVCPNCGERSLIFMEGCFTCNSCGHSKCS